MDHGDTQFLAPAVQQLLAPVVQQFFERILDHD
jgi:hypothetical protein